MKLHSTGERIHYLRGHESRESFSKRYGVHPHTVMRWEKDIRTPQTNFLAALARDYSVSIDWLIHGEGSPATMNKERPLAYLPVRGLAECGIEGWYTSGILPIQVSTPPGNIPPESFAVITVGNSMLPAHIAPGQVLICGPEKVEAGDAVYIERVGGAGTVKQYICEDDAWYCLRGWLDSGQPYEVKERRENITKLYPVLWIKKK